jgi:hypothetical protein
VHHRHLSHLFGLFPGHTITVEKAPDLCEAAEISLNKRGFFLFKKNHIIHLFWELTRLLILSSYVSLVLGHLDTPPILRSLLTPPKISTSFNCTSYFGNLLICF